MELFFYFLVYGFGGWLLENGYNWYTERVFFKENLLFLPIKPMYGIAPVLLIISVERFPYWFVVLPLCFFIPSFVEYVTGAFLEKATGRKWWDYSKGRYHIHGHVCLAFSACWIFLSLIVLYYLHPTVAQLFAANPDFWSEFAAAMSVPFAIDTVIATLTLRSRTSTPVVPIEE